MLITAARFDATARARSRRALRVSMTRCHAQHDAELRAAHAVVNAMLERSLPAMPEDAAACVTPRPRQTPPLMFTAPQRHHHHFDDVKMARVACAAPNHRHARPFAMLSSASPPPASFAATARTRVAMTRRYRASLMPDKCNAHRVRARFYADKIFALPAQRQRELMSCPRRPHAPAKSAMLLTRTSKALLPQDAAAKTLMTTVTIRVRDVAPRHDVTLPRRQRHRA